MITLLERAITQNKAAKNRFLLRNQIFCVAFLWSISGAGMHAFAALSNKVFAGYQAPEQQEEQKKKQDKKLPKGDAPGQYPVEIDINQPQKDLLSARSKKDIKETGQQLQAGNPPGPAPMVVPVRPMRQKALPDIPDKTEDLSHLGNQYLTLDDGSVLTVRDWVLGPLRRSYDQQPMTDFDQRLFLGRIATNLAGEPLPFSIGGITPYAANQQSFPTYIPVAASPVKELAASLGNLVAGFALTGVTQDGLGHIRAYSPLQFSQAREYDAFLFQRQFATEMQHVTFDWTKRRIFENRAREALKRLEDRKQADPENP